MNVDPDQDHPRIIGRTVTKSLVIYYVLLSLDIQDPRRHGAPPADSFSRQEQINPGTDHR